MAYLLIFAITIGVSFLYEHASSNTNRIGLRMIRLIIILIPAVFASLRDVSIGTDNSSYVQIFNYCLANSLSESVNGLSSAIEKESVEVGFVVFTWICAKAFPNYHFFNFITSLITMILVVIGADYYKKRISFTWIITTYLFVFFCPMLNFVRQAITLAIVFVSWRYAEQQIFWKFIGCVALAGFIHISSLIILPIYILFRFKDSKRYGRIVFIIAVSMIFVILIGPSLVYQILTYLAGFGIRTEVLLKYSRRFMSGQYSFNLNFLLRFLPQLVVGSLLYKRIKQIDVSNKIYYSMMWIQMPLVIMGSMYDNFARLALYYQYSVLIMFPSFEKCEKRYGTFRILDLVLIAYLIFYWVVFTVLNHYNFLMPVYPFKLFF